MPLLPEDIDRIEASRPILVRDPVRTGEAFFDILFEASPGLRPMFPQDVSDQGRKFATTLAVAIDSARDWNRLAPVLENLARRHLAYSVEPEHYDTVGAALLATLDRLGADDGQLEAWERVYDVVSAHMIASAYPGQPVQAT